MSSDPLKVLVVMPSTTSGGAEKALVSFLIGLSRYNLTVDLLLFQEKGLFYSSIPQSVAVQSTPRKIAMLYGPLTAIIKSLASTPLDALAILFVRLLSWSLVRLFWTGTMMAKMQHVWPLYRSVIEDLSDHYDVAIAYQQGHAINFVVDRVDATIKVGWMHSSYRANGFSPKVDAKYFDALDLLCGVSEEVVRDLHDAFGLDFCSIMIVRNIIEPEVIRVLAKESFPWEIPRDRLTISSIGRLAPQKGFERFIHSLSLLKRSSGFRFKAFILGEGPEKSRLEELIELEGLADEVELLGVVMNPYPLLQNSDIYVQASEFEGYGLAAKEARILGIPLVLTNFDTAQLHVVPGYNGLVVEGTPEDLARGILTVTRSLDQYSLRAQDLASHESAIGSQDLEQLVSTIQNLMRDRSS